MALLLAPYNDSMRLGMGFNSYTQTMCIDGAVDVTNDSKTTTESPSQVVTYSSRFVERLSDVVSSMNISYSSAIKKGTIEVSGNGNSIDEDKIKSSDLNLIVSVQVINQTTSIKDSALFKPLESVQPGSQAFNDAFGDCYISGFIEGGDFNSIISMRCLDRSKTDSVVQAIKKTAKSSEPKEFSMDSYSMSNSFSNSSAMKDTETTVAVNWKGGGQIKDPKTTWDVDSVYAAAAAFPSYVATTPQKTWAILTRYKANRSYSLWALARSLQPLEYDAIISYTAELFNNFMEYKQLVKTVQNMISNRADYEGSTKHNAIPPTISTLVAVRSALRNEMNKIVAVVNVLSQNPHLLQQSSSFNIVSKDAIVRHIMDEAIMASPDALSKVLFDTAAVSKAGPPVPVAIMPAEKPSSVAESVDSTGDFQAVDHADASKTPATEEPPTVPALASAPATGPPAKNEPTKMDLSSLIAPEVWADLLPVRVKGTSVDLDTTAASAAAVTIFPPPPKDDAAMQFLAKKPAGLEILAAVCGIQDVTQVLRDRVKDGQTLEVMVTDIDSLVHSPSYADLPQPFSKNLSFIYQYDEGPMRFASANYDPQSPASIQINAKVEHPEVSATKWENEAWSVVAIVYGGNLFNDEASVKNVQDQIRADFAASANGNRRATVNNVTFNRDPWAGTVKTGIIYYTSKDKGPIRAAVGVEGQSCCLTEAQQLAVLATTKEVIKEVSNEVIRTVEVPKEVVKEVPSNQIVLSGVQSGRLSCTFESDQFVVNATETPFLRFDNGVSFKYQPDGNFVVYSGDGLCAWATDKCGDSDALRFQGDGNFVAYSHGGPIWTTETHGNPGSKLVLSSAKPFVEVFKADGVRVWNSW